MTRDVTELTAGVVGTGFIGAVHVEALRRRLTEWGVEPEQGRGVA